MFLMSLPNSLQKAIDFFEKLPGIGPKTAKRLGFYLLRLPQSDLEDFASNITRLKSSSHFCQICFNLTEAELCSICEDVSRDPTTISVVEDVLDLLSMEQSRNYRGVYHVLHGKIDPLNYTGPEDIQIDSLIKRVENAGETREIILATNPNTEGEATAMYIKKKIGEVLNGEAKKIKITRLAYGLPIGADLEYADYMTLQHALAGRKDF